MGRKRSKLRFGGISPYTGEGLGRNAEIGGDHVLGKAVGYGRKLLQKMTVFFFGIETNIGFDALLHHDEALLQQAVDEVVKGGYFATKAVEVRLSDQNDPGVFDGIDV